MKSSRAGWVSLFAGLAAMIELSGAQQGKGPLPRGTPESQGVPSGALLEFVEAADGSVNEMHSLMVVRNGVVVAEGWWAPYGPEDPHVLFSLSKSFTSTAVGLAVAEGKLNVDDEVLKAFPEDAPAEPSNQLKGMRLRDLLMMSTGHQNEPGLAAATNQAWTKTFLAHPVPHKPGAHFLYNTPATYMQSAMVQKATGQTVLDYLRPRLFEPLGIENPIWGTSPQGITLGGYGLSVRTEDLAKFGQLYLQKGMWGGRQLVPATWVEAATARQTSNGSSPKSDWDQGYGYQFWRCRNGGYRGDGAFGQYCIVLPEKSAVIAITSGTKDMQNVMNLIWDKLLPAFGAGPLPEDAGSQKQLKEKLAALSLRFPEGQAASPIANKISGQKYGFAPNDRKLEWAALETNGAGGPVLVMNIGGVEQRVPCGHRAWRKSRAALGGPAAQPVAGAGAWTSEETFTAKIPLYETPFVMTATLKFSDGGLVFDSEMNVGFGPTKQPTLTGQKQ